MGVPSFNVHNENTVAGRQALEHEQHNMYRRILGAKTQVRSSDGDSSQTRVVAHSRARGGLESRARHVGSKKKKMKMKFGTKNAFAVPLPFLLLSTS